MLSFMLTHVLSSELAPCSVQLLTTLLLQYLDNSCFCIVNGIAEVVTALLEHPYGYIMCPGAGPEHHHGCCFQVPHPVTLELGGK
jgi:acyl-CoA reductase-like NAD-dependent aldehyde dehydrogenase